MSERQIVHIDMDAFYASVEQRDDPELRGKPVVVAWKGNRSVVCAASYEARKFGVRSAMPAVTAERLCPSAIFIPPDFTRYRAVSQQVREIFALHTEHIEPLSLDEAYLDVSQTASGLEVAKAIRAQIWEKTNLTASAGVAPNKFLAKIASDWKKPNGLFEVRREDVESFLGPLPLGKLPGVGKVTEQRLASFGMKTVGDLRLLTLAVLEGRFGSHGRRLYELARGIDESPVTSDRPTKSISAEDTFEADILIGETIPVVTRLAKRVWESAMKEERVAKTVVLKLKTSDFHIHTRSHTPPTAISSGEELLEIVLWLVVKLDLDPDVQYRLVGVGLGNLGEKEDKPVQLKLFS